MSRSSSPSAPTSSRACARRSARTPSSVRFEDMAVLGHNPARIIPAWRDFLERRHRPGGGIRGIGEPIWAGRSATELVECQLHESLLNVAFAGVRGFRLLCPYDVDRARRGRRPRGVLQPSARQREPEPRLPPRRGTARAVRLAAPAAARAGTAARLRAGHARRGAAARPSTAPRGRGWSAPARRTSSSRSASWRPTASATAAAAASCASGRTAARSCARSATAGGSAIPLAGRHAPDAEQLGGRGLWIANAVCDLVQVRSGRQGTAVRFTWP